MLEGDAPTRDMEARPVYRRLGEGRQRGGHLERLRPAPQPLVAPTKGLQHALGLRRQDARQLERLDGAVGVAKLRLQDPRDGDELARLLAGRSQLVQAMATKLERARPVAHLGRLGDERMN